MSRLRIVYGNAFTTLMVVEASAPSGGVVAFDLESCTDISASAVNRYGKTALAYEVQSADRIRLSWPETLPIGDYAVEITGEYESHHWRLMIEDVLAIVLSNNRANIPADSIIDGGYVVSAEMYLLEGGAVVQSDWTENDSASPSYIQNKPILAAVAISGSYADLSGRPTLPTKTSDLVNDSGFLTEHQDISGKADVAHTHQVEDVIYLQGILDGKASSAHTHTTTDITDWSAATSGFLTEHQDISGKADVVHTHTISDTTGLQTALDGKAAASHTHTHTSITDWDDATGHLKKISVFNDIWDDLEGDGYTIVDDYPPAATITAMGIEGLIFDKETKRFYYVDTDESKAYTKWNEQNFDWFYMLDYKDYYDSVLETAKDGLYFCAGNDHIYVISPSDDLYEKIAYSYDLPTIDSAMSSTSIRAVQNKVIYAELAKKEDKLSVQTTSASSGTLSSFVGNYYKFSVSVGTITLNLRKPSDTSKTSLVMFSFTTAATCAVTFSAQNSVPIYYQDGFSIEPSSLYEVSALYNGSVWTVTAIKIVTSL